MSPCCPFQFVCWLTSSEYLLFFMHTSSISLLKFAGLFLWLRNWQNYRWEWQYSLSCMLFWRWSFYLMKQAARANLLVPRLKPLQVLCTAWNSNSAITLLMHYKFFNQVCLFFCYLGVVCLSKFYDIICLHTAYSISFNRERNNK